ncbi:hypothetical protein LJR045_000993 [Microbacterium sp. LjRoot45]|uniref:hypothetical protein n=1 Tax=Microbacterium sp. LjRoot45 TaxID=3342329 RepID=UPI003ECEE919
MDDPETEPPLRTVVCHTPDCGNAEIPVTLRCLELVVCNPCGQLITDITTH